MRNHRPGLKAVQCRTGFSDGSCMNNREEKLMEGMPEKVSLALVE